MYEGFIDVAKKHLFRRALNHENTPIIVSGDVRVAGSGEDMSVAHTARGQHLTCFAGGMVGLAARIFNRPHDLDVASQLTESCVWSYRVTTTGIGPEIFTFAPCGSVEDSQTSEECVYSDNKWRQSLRKYWRPHNVHLEGPEAPLEDMKEEIDLIIRDRQLPPGMVDMPERKYILRPEAIESVFVMHRITGDPAWMDKAWDMFSHIDNYSRTAIAAAGLDDVTSDEPRQVDNMESFWLAETLKYFYLMFTDWETVSLDKWVLNTEAHPLKRPDA